MLYAASGLCCGLVVTLGTEARSTAAGIDAGGHRRFLRLRAREHDRNKKQARILSVLVSSSGLQSPVAGLLNEARYCLRFLRYHP
jgi:hypothetical protein